MTSYVYNGRFVAGNRLEIEVDQPYFAHGAGLFETLRAYRGSPCHLGLHTDRMFVAARALGVALAYTESDMAAQVGELLDRSALEHARIKLHLLVRDDRTSDLLVTAAPAPPLSVLGDEVRLGRASDGYNGAGAMAGYKTMNYMVNRLALDEGARRGLDEVYFTLPDGTVTEGSRSTVFCVKDGLLITAPLDLPVLPGVTRHVILALARKSGISVRERAFSAADLRGAEEAMLTGSVLGIRPVASVDGRVFDEVPGPITLRLAEAYHADLTDAPGA